MAQPPYLPGPKACQALDLHCAGYSLRQIAARMGNAPSTVSKLLTAGARALGLPNGNRVLLAVAWAHVSPLVETKQEEGAAGPAVNAQPGTPNETQPAGPVPIYALIDPVTRKRKPPAQVPESRKKRRRRKGRKEREAPTEPQALPQAALAALGALNALPQTASDHCPDGEAPQRRRTLRAARKWTGPIVAQKRADVAHQRIGLHARWSLRRRPRQCARCSYGLFVEVCHIRPVCTFPADALLGEINAPDNLIYLCPNCHHEFDAGLWTLPGHEGAAETATAPQVKQAAYSSAYRGVSWDKQKQLWRAAITSQGRRCALGRFREERDAALAYNAAALRLWGERAVLNDVE